MYVVENRDGWVLDAEADNFQYEYFTEAVIRTLDSRVTNEGLMSLEADSKGMVTVPSEDMLIYNKSDKHVGYPADYEPSKSKVKGNEMEM